LARLGPFRPHRDDCLEHPANGDYAPRWCGLDRISRPRPRKAFDIEHTAARGAGRLARLEVAVYLSEPRCCERQPACGSRRGTYPLLPYICKCVECVLHTATRQHDLHDEWHDDAVVPES